MTGKRKTDVLGNELKNFFQQSKDLDKFLQSPENMKEYIRALWGERSGYDSRIKELEEVKDALEKENSNLRKQNADSQETEKKLVELQTLNGTLRRQLEAFCNMTVYASIGFVIADAMIDWITTDFGSLTEIQGDLFVFGLLLRVLGVSAIWCCLHSADLFKYLFKNNKKHVETNSREAGLQQTENVS